MSDGDPRLGDVQGLLALIQLEREIRRAPDLTQLGFLVVNDSVKLLRFRQAYLLPIRGSAPRLKLASGLAEIDRDAPFVVWLEDLAGGIARSAGKRSLMRLGLERSPPALRSGWSEWEFGHGVCGMMRQRDGSLSGLLILSRTQPWSDAEIELFSQLFETFDHAWRALLPDPTSLRARLGRMLRQRRAWLIAGVALLALMLFPITDTTVGTAEIVPDNPSVVAAPVDGVVRKFLVSPNSEVTIGQPLVALDDTTSRNRVEVARRALATAQAEHMRATQRAFSDDASRRERDLLAARVQEREADLAYANDLMTYVTLNAERAGVVLFGDESDWVGKPVQTGEKIAVIADPEQRKIRIQLPADSLIPLEIGNTARLYFDIDPISGLASTLSNIGFTAEPTAAGTMAYRLEARFVEPPDAVYRIGLRGTARISGPRVTLFYMLARRPLAMLRHHLGI